MFQPSVQFDPLNSLYPVPWNWVMATLTAVAPDASPSTHYYRSPSLISPNQEQAAYTRIQMTASPLFFESQVHSVLFVENLRSGNLQTIIPTSPLANNPFLGQEQEQTGAISMVIPVSWSSRGDRLLARAFESVFGSDLASDYAVIVDFSFNRITTVAPRGIQYSNAVLLGWSETHPERALFRAGMIGQSSWDLWTVDAMGTTALIEDDRPVTFGETVSNVWMGPQVRQ